MSRMDIHQTVLRNARAPTLSPVRNFQERLEPRLDPAFLEHRPVTLPPTTCPHTVTQSISKLWQALHNHGWRRTSKNTENRVLCTRRQPTNRPLDQGAVSQTMCSSTNICSSYCDQIPHRRRQRMESRCMGPCNTSRRPGRTSQLLSVGKRAPPFLKVTRPSTTKNSAALVRVLTRVRHCCFRC